METVTDVARSREFYTGLLGFDIAVDSPPPDDPTAQDVYPVLFGGLVMVRGSGTYRVWARYHEGASELGRP